MVWTMRRPAATQATTGERCNRQLSLSPYGGQSTFITKSTDKPPPPQKKIFVFTCCPCRHEKQKRYERHYSWTSLQHYFCMLSKKSRKKNSTHNIVLDVHVIIINFIVSIFTHIYWLRANCPIWLVRLQGACHDQTGWIGQLSSPWKW